MPDQATTAVLSSTATVGLTSYPIAESQLEVWLASQQNAEANCAYNECSSLHLRGPLDTDALQRAVEGVVQRHEGLRATFSANGQTTTIHDQLPFDYTFVDWSSLPSTAQVEAHRQAILEEGTTPFDLEYGPLLRVRLQKLAENDHLLTFTAHHIVMDGWSLWLFCRDLGHLYDTELNANPSSLPEPQPYQLFVERMAQYQASDEAEGDATFWKQQFAGDLPSLELPTDRPRPALKTFSGDRYDHVVEAELVAALRQHGGKAGCSLFHTLLAGFQAFVARIAGQTDVCVGIPAAGQNATELHEVLGHCVNSLPLRNRVDPKGRFIDFAKTVRSSVLDAMDHQRYTFGTLLRQLSPPRDPSRPPIFQVMFNIDPEVNVEELGFHGLEVELDIEPRARENFEWFINGVVRQDGAVEFQCQYNTDLFDRESVAHYFESFEALLCDVAADPTAKIENLRLLSRRQAQQMIVDWNDTSFEFPEDASVHEVVRRQSG
ncbi:MAG: condensation domain-containing protein, partial [Planctomycetota bacterium]